MGGANPLRCLAVIRTQSALQTVLVADGTRNRCSFDSLMTISAVITTGDFWQFAIAGY